MIALLFVSYRRSQLDRVRPAVEALRAAGIDCFFDLDAIDPLADFPERIRQGIAGSHALLAWWSDDYAESDHCLAEFRLAWQHARRQNSDVGRRVWVLNPELRADHVTAGELDARNFLQPPKAGAETAWAASLRERLQPLLPEGPLADERHVFPVPERRNVPTPAREFTGRSADLLRIHSKLHPPRINVASLAVAVQTHGLGGIGKTELAAKYAHDFALAYPGGIVWLNLAGYEPGPAARREEAENAWLKAVEEAYRGDSALLQDAEGKALPAPVVHRLLETRFAPAEPYLWVLDNVPVLRPEDEREHILGFWRAPTAAGRTLVTTRDSSPAAGFAAERLDVLGEEDALRLLARFCVPSEQELNLARAIVTAVGAHTLALALGLIGHRLRRGGLGGYAGALAALRESSSLAEIETLATRLEPLLGKKARGIVATLRISVELLDDAAQRVLGFASVCAPNEPIPVGLLQDAFAGDDWAFADALDTLLAASLLTRRRDQTQPDAPVEIHPLVADAAANLLAVDPTEVREIVGQALLSRVVDADDIYAHARIGDDIRQAEHLAFQLDSSTGIYLALRVGGYQHARGAYALARVAEEHAYRAAQHLLGEEHPDTLIAMANLAGTLRAQGELGGARGVQERVLEACRRVLGEEHSITLKAMAHLAGTLQAQGDLGEARGLQERVLEACRRRLDEEHTATLAAMHNLAGTLRAQGELGGARGLQEEVLAVSRRVLGEEHRATLAAMNNLARTLQVQGELGGARGVQERVLEARRRVLGEEHPATLAAMNNLAQTLQAQSDLGGARGSQEEVLAVSRRVLGEEHPDTLLSAWSLFVTYYEQSDGVACAELLKTTALLQLLETADDQLSANLQAIKASLATLIDQSSAD